MSINSPVISALPNNLLNGTPNDASQVMADFNTIRNGVNNALSGVSASSGASYIGVTTDARWIGTSVQDALAQLISNTQVNDTGTVNAIAFTTTPNITALTNNLFVWFKAGNTNTSSTVTIAAGTTPATALVLNDGVTLPAIGSIISGQIYGAWYSTGLSKWVLINPSIATGSFTASTTGMSAATGTLNYFVDTNGRSVDLWAASTIGGTGVGTTASITQIPPGIQTVTSKSIMALLQDNSAFLTNGHIVTGASSSSFNITNTIGGSGGLTAGNVRAIPAQFYVRYNTY